MKKVYYIPEGIENLKKIFPYVDFSLVEKWNVQVLNAENEIIAQTRDNVIGCCCFDKKRISFVNSLGETESVNFTKPQISNEIKSSVWEKSIKVSSKNKHEHSLIRSNITSNETVEVETNCFTEMEMHWLDELATTEKAWVEELEGSTKIQVPINIEDMRFVKRKSKDRFEYFIKISYTMSHKNLTRRS
ncbi:hypothetical protein [Empedobacter falsenii]|uniref:hypothetical protein n=1 Tax=Empedobacter falsenii TaxID=343874 RepID=UPI003A81217B